MNIFDCTMFFNENDLLEIRLNEHWNFVDKFIIIEAKETHTGLPKPLNFDHERFEKYLNKIEYVVIDNFKESMLEFPWINCSIGRRVHNHHEDWARDHFQFNYTVKVLLDLGADNNDIVYFSCLDEILSQSGFERAIDFLKTNHGKFHGYNWTNKSTVIDYFKPCVNFIMSFYAYKFNLQRFKPEDGYVAGGMTFFENLKTMMPATIRANALVTHPHIPNGGYHFTYIDSGDGEFILKKYKSWAHANDIYPDGSKRSDITDPKLALEFMLREFNMDVLRSKVSITRSTHPGYLVDNIDKFQSMIYRDN